MRWQSPIQLRHSGEANSLSIQPHSHRIPPHETDREAVRGKLRSDWTTRSLVSALRAREGGEWQKTLASNFLPLSPSVPPSIPPSLPSSLLPSLSLFLPPSIPLSLHSFIPPYLRPPILPPILSLASHSALTGRPGSTSPGNKWMWNTSELFLLHSSLLCSCLDFLLLFNAR